MKGHGAPWRSAPLNRIAPAFAAAVVSASGIHAALLTVSMVRRDSSNLNVPVNNLVRFVLIAIGGVPVAAAAALSLGVPAYLLVRRTVGVTAASAIVSGVAIGLAVSLVFAGLVPSALISSPAIGMSIGGISAAVWWLVAFGRRRRQHQRHEIP